MPNETTSNELKVYCLKTAQALYDYKEPLEDAFSAIKQTDITTFHDLNLQVGYFNSRLTTLRDMLNSLTYRGTSGCSAMEVIDLSSNIGNYLARMRRALSHLPAKAAKPGEAATKNSDVYLADIEARLPDIPAQLLKMGGLRDIEKSEADMAAYEAEETRRTFSLHEHSKAVAGLNGTAVETTEDSRKALWLHNEAVKALKMLDGLAERQPGQLYMTAKATGLPMEKSTPGFLLLKQLLSEVGNGDLERPNTGLVKKITQSIIGDLREQIVKDNFQEEKVITKNKKVEAAIAMLECLPGDLERSSLSMADRIRKNSTVPLQL